MTWPATNALRAGLLSLLLLAIVLTAVAQSLVACHKRLRKPTAFLITTCSRWLTPCAMASPCPP